MADPEPVSNPDARVVVNCPCGWTDTFSKGYSGLVIECLRCGKSHRIPTFATAGVDDLDPGFAQRMMAAMSVSPAPLVNLKPYFIASAVVCVIAAIASVFVRPYYPYGVVILGGALSWPLGLWVAWLGQRRQLKRAPGDAKS